MSTKISLSDVYDKDLSFLIGSGASAGLFPTLRLAMNDVAGKPTSIEDLAAQFDHDQDVRKTPLFMHYYTKCIRPAQEFSLATALGHPTQKKVVENYQAFLEKILSMLAKRKSTERRCNVFTTNYDGCIPLVADEMLRRGALDFALNDGARGFKNRYLQARHFNSHLVDVGVFDRHQASVPQINLIHLHGSVYWTKRDGSIAVDYRQTQAPLLDAAATAKLKPFSATLDDSKKTLADLADPGFAKAVEAEFWKGYEELPIVNPTKWKFHETVFEEHYYQMLRLLSYELEKPNAVLVTFGFSFADEHILNLVKRSLANPRLQVFVCCYDEGEHGRLQHEFAWFKNVQCISLGGKPLDFDAFNSAVLTLDTAAFAAAD